MSAAAGVAVPLLVRRPGRVDYASALEAMRRFTAGRGSATADELWLLEHEPVYTLGMSCRLLPRPAAGAIPVVATDRGGQITYHGPGQLVAYVLMDLRRRRDGVRGVVSALEQVVIDLLCGLGIAAERRPGAPGVYVGGAKIAALGLRVRRGCTYHGLSLNVDVDLAPFSAIDPCGYPGLAVTRLSDLGVGLSVQAVGDRLAAGLAERFGYAARNAPPGIDPVPARQPASGAGDNGERRRLRVES